MTKPDEALLWAREERVKFWERSSASRKDIAMHVAAARAGDYDRNLHDDVYLRRSWLDGHRAGAAASEARIKALEEALIKTGASLAAAISLLEHGGRKAAASDKMFEIMLEDYRAALSEAHALLKEADQ